MERPKFLYGPVSSFRIGISLGVDLLIHRKKICNLNCLYCQIGETDLYVGERRVYVKTEKILRELEGLPSIKFDYITFSGNGEPTLAKNLGEAIKAIKASFPFPVAVITNSTMIGRDNIAEELSGADYVIAKLDACSPSLFEKINRPKSPISFENLVSNLKEFKSFFKGRFAIQVMFVEANKNYAKEIASIVKEILPNEIHIDTPLRPSKCKPLPFEELKELEHHFEGQNIPLLNVYEAKRKETWAINSEDTVRRRGQSS